MRNQEQIKNFLDGILKCGKQLEVMLTLRMAAFLIECGDSRCIPPTWPIVLNLWYSFQNGLSCIINSFASHSDPWAKQNSHGWPRLQICRFLALCSYASCIISVLFQFSFPFPPPTFMLSSFPLCRLLPCVLMWVLLSWSCSSRHTVSRWKREICLSYSFCEYWKSITLCPITLVDTQIMLKAWMFHTSLRGNWI